MYNIIKHPDQFSVIVCYLPVIPMERTLKHDSNELSDNVKRTYTDTSVQMQHLHSSNAKNIYKFNHLWSVGSSNLHSSSNRSNRLTLIDGQPMLANNVNTDEMNRQLNISPDAGSLDLGLLGLEKNTGYKDH